MKLFTAKELNTLKKLLASVGDQDEVLTLAGLHGLLYCLAIIPETISPSEWLPCFFGEGVLEIEDEDEANKLMGGLFTAYNRLVRESNDDELQFPFDLGKLKASDIARVRDWAYGFFLGINLRPEIWGLPDGDDETEEEDDEGSEEEQEVAACMAVLMGVAFPDKIPELFEVEPGEEMDQATLKEQEAKFFVALPQAMETFQEIANERRELRRKIRSNMLSAPAPVHRSEKIGRNEPCPCGSGKKYKKCCGGELKR
jgi:uncharacterized protein